MSLPEESNSGWDEKGERSLKRHGERLPISRVSVVAVMGLQYPWEFTGGSQPFANISVTHIHNLSYLSVSGYLSRFLRDYRLRFVFSKLHCSLVSDASLEKLVQSSPIDPFSAVKMMQLSCHVIRILGLMIQVRIRIDCDNAEFSERRKMSVFVSSLF